MIKKLFNDALACLVNKSFAEEIVLDGLQIAEVCPIYKTCKSGNKLELTNVSIASKHS